MIDRNWRKLTLQKVTPKFEELKTYNLSKELLYGRSWWDGHYLQDDGYYIAFVLQNEKKVKLYRGFNYECEGIGKVIREFLNIPLKYF